MLDEWGGGSFFVGTLPQWLKLSIVTTLYPNCMVLKIAHTYTSDIRNLFLLKNTSKITPLKGRGGLAQLLHFHIRVPQLLTMIVAIPVDIIEVRWSCFSEVFFRKDSHEIRDALSVLAVHRPFLIYISILYL